MLIRKDADRYIEETVLAQVSVRVSANTSTLKKTLRCCSRLFHGMHVSKQKNTLVIVTLCQLHIYSLDDYSDNFPISISRSQKGAERGH